MLTETFIDAHRDYLPAETIEMTWPLSTEGPVQRTLGRLSTHLFGRNWIAATAYRRLFKRMRCTAVLAEYGLSGVAVLDGVVHSGLPLIVHFFGFDAYRTDILQRNADAYGHLFSRASALVVVSEAMRAQLLSLGAPATKLHVIPPGVDCSEAAASPATASPIVLAVGRFTDKKAPHLTLLAFARAYATRPDAHLRWIGDGPLLPVCRELAAGLDVAGAVTFLGPQEPDAVRREMQAARCFVQHSVVAASGDSEGTPVAVLQASGAGLPVVATRHAGISEVVRDGETGFLVEERDVGAMAARLGQILDDAGLAGRLGGCGRKYVQETHSMKHRIDQLWQVIESASSESH